ncbi:MAG: translation initiation factor IF-3 [Candidatus Porifericomitaceae bacterium WSBS_2022_MAG_OTU9]
MKLIAWEGNDISTSDKHRINLAIDNKQIRLIDAEGKQVGLVDTDDARRRALDEGYDLVEIEPTAAPPVCRLMDYGKHLFLLSKKKQAARKKQKQTSIKELKFRPRTGEGDYQIKLRNLLKFLEQGDKVKITMRFRGREMSHPELGMKLLERIAADLGAHGKVEQEAKLEGRQIVMTVSP